MNLSDQEDHLSTDTKSSQRMIVDSENMHPRVLSSNEGIVILQSIQDIRDRLEHLTVTMTEQQRQIRDGLEHLIVTITEQQRQDQEQRRLEAEQRRLEAEQRRLEAEQRDKQWTELLDVLRKLLPNSVVSSVTATGQS
ncbi:hypothetical protein K435DRAFT_848963 [Dendrothele bispora CBS 962.96]|uniref:Uncharacterized protein n=1 Tax=Dendrothele bispora (strain CBS 962.96) TaxID=1314807 RepID=A0A4S8MTH1_DENBC|nr:hypothetical protein K435DRAFT_848963 [Dendrothele bispora CBS 962.96]